MEDFQLGAVGRLKASGGWVWEVKVLASLQRQSRTVSLRALALRELTRVHVARSDSPSLPEVLFQPLRVPVSCLADTRAVESCPWCCAVKMECIQH